MAPPVATASAPVLLVCGEDEFGVKQRARQIFQDWCAAVGGIDHETIDATVGNNGEALKALARLREALQTLPFFGGGKVIWLQNCNFLGDERTAGAAAVTETLAEIAEELKRFSWDNVRLLISAGKVDKRKVFYKTLEKLGRVELMAGWSAEEKGWADQAENWAAQQFKALKKTISDEALALLVSYVGPHARQLHNEVEKLAVYVGDRAEIGAGDVEAIVTRHKQARAFALGDALGDRDLPRLLRALDAELWEVQIDKQRSEIGLLYGLISKVRVIQTVTGGGFGGKIDNSVHVLVALLTWRTGRPVKLTYSREESIIASTKRHPFTMYYKLGAKKDGRLVAARVEIYGDTGAYSSFGPAVLTRTATCAIGPYEVANAKIDTYAVYTNNPVSGAMRAFGSPQAQIAYESLMDELANKLGISPLAIRRINAYKEGSSTVTGQVLSRGVGMLETIDRVVEKAASNENLLEGKRK